jgi:hypothetical protein
MQTRLHDKGLLFPTSVNREIVYRLGAHEGAQLDCSGTAGFLLGMRSEASGALKVTATFLDGAID